MLYSTISSIETNSCITQMRLRRIPPFECRSKTFNDDIKCYRVLGFCLNVINYSWNRTGSYMHILQTLRLVLLIAPQLFLKPSQLQTLIERLDRCLDLKGIFHLFHWMIFQFDFKRNPFHCHLLLLISSQMDNHFYKVLIHSEK